MQLAQSKNKLLRLASLIAMAAVSVGAASLPSAFGQSQAAECSLYAVWDSQWQPCGAQGYALSTGVRYCKRFSSLGTNDLTPEGLLWRDAARSCLLDAFFSIVTDIEVLSCQQIRRRAFSSHPGC